MRGGCAKRAAGSGQRAAGSEQRAAESEIRIWGTRDEGPGYGCVCTQRADSEERAVESEEWGG